MSVENEKLFWKKKEYISFVLSILVFFIHFYFASSVTSDSFISLVNHKVSFFFSRSITQFAVPMFFIMSGMTFFKGYKSEKYKTKIKSRIFTLVLPYLVWNTIWMLYEIFSSYSFLARFSNAAEPYPLNLLSLLKGVFFYSCNTPFWFIFDIIVFSFAAPLVFLIIRNKFIGFSTVVLLSVVSVFGIYLPESVFYYPMAIVFYLIGAIIGYHYFDKASKKSSKPLQIASLIFLFSYVLLKNVVPRDLHITNYLIEVIIFTASSFALWFVVDAFIEKIKSRPIFSRSFAIYAMHLNVAMILLKIFSFITPESEWLEIPKFAITVLLTLTLINLFVSILERFFPRINSLLMGSRTKK